MRCGEATGSRAELARFVDVDESWIARDIVGLALHVNDGFAMHRDVPHAGVVLHRDKFEQALAQRATAAGACIRLSTTVSALERTESSVRGVRLDSGEVVEARLVIGADGAESMVGRWAGITRPLKLAEAYSAAQYRMRTGFCNDGRLHFFVGSRTIPRGYLWVFPKGNGEVSVGAGIYGPRAGEPTAHGYLTRFIDAHLPGVARDRLITGCVPLAACPPKLHRDNVVLVGDAARQCNPFTAGGIMNTLEAADLLARQLVRAGSRGVHGASSEEYALRAYSRRWSGRPRFEQNVFVVFMDMMQTSTDRDIEHGARTVDRIFNRPIDRSHPFRVPVWALARLALVFLPKVVRRIPLLFG